MLRRIPKDPLEFFAGREEAMEGIILTKSAGYSIMLRTKQNAPIRGKSAYALSGDG
jgi:hypothetical protein